MLGIYHGAADKAPVKDVKFDDLRLADMDPEERKMHSGDEPLTFIDISLHQRTDGPLGCRRQGDPDWLSTRWPRMTRTWETPNAAQRIGGASETGTLLGICEDDGGRQHLLDSTQAGAASSPKVAQ